MAIQYAGGTNVNATLTQVAGTRAELAQWIRDQLIVAGWTSSGSATDYQLTSATTPQGLAGRVRSWDAGSGNCAQLRISNTAGTVTQAGSLFLLPAVAQVWRIIANRYQAFVFAPGSTTSRKSAAFGVPYTFTGFGATECIWAFGDARNDTDTTVRDSFRRRLCTGYSSSEIGNWAGIWNGTLTENNNNSNSGPGCIQLCNPGGSNYTQVVPAPTTHKNAAVPILEPKVGWGATNLVDTRWVGQLWDAVIAASGITGDQTRTVDAKTFWAVTDTNVGSNQNYAAGTLLVYAP